MTTSAPSPIAPDSATVSRPLVNRLGPLAWMRRNLFSTWYNALLTVLIVWVLAQAIPALFHWLISNSLLAPATSQECRLVDGACWAFIQEKYRLILFGTFPYNQQWRPLFAVVLVIAMLLASCDRRMWNRRLGVIWGVGMTMVAILMWGGVLGLDYVENSLWGGLPLTLLLAVVGLAVAFPLSILLALGRRSRLPIIKSLSVTYIELIRGVPLISLLFMASVMLPLFLPVGMNPDKLLRAQIAFIMFAAAYLAEVIRGGLQAIPRGQYEAADALGLTYWQKTVKIILPQALTIVIPPIVNTFIAFFKDTSLVMIIGIFDLMNASKAALNDAEWRGFYRESYLFIAVIYFVFCFFMSKYSQSLERDLKRGHQH
ncbi:MAG: ABC transporter permease subunit [Azospirillum sp.]|nr:ABC transporter permease subunit [Azospirillum sp.]